MTFDLNEYLNYVHKQQREQDELYRKHYAELMSEHNRLYREQVDNLAHEVDKLLNNKKLLSTAQLREYKDHVEFVWRYFDPEKEQDSLDVIEASCNFEEHNEHSLEPGFVPVIIDALSDFWSDTDGADTKYRDKKFYEIVGHKISCTLVKTDPTKQVQGPVYILRLEKNKCGFLQQLFGRISK